MSTTEDQLRLEAIRKLRGMMQPTPGVTVLPQQGVVPPEPQMPPQPQMQAAPPPQPDVVPPSQAMVPPDRSYAQRADALEAQAAPPPDPYAHMSPWKQMLVHGLQGAAGGAIHAQESGGYTGYLDHQQQVERQREQDLLARAKELRGEGYQRERDYTQAQQFQAGQESQQATRQQALDIANRPQFKEFGTAGGGYLYGGVNPQTAEFTQQGEIPGTATTKAETDKNIGNYVNKAGHHVEIFQKPDGTTYERPFGEVRPPQSLGAGSYGESNIVNRLTQQWDKASKDVTDLYRANTIMQSGLEAARHGDLNAGSQAVLITFQKFLDPQSVVRESEYARSAEGLSMANRISGFVQRMEQGGAGVTLPELETFAKLAQQINANLAREGNSLLAKQADRIRRNAQHFGIPEDLIFSGYDFNQNPTDRGGGDKTGDPLGIR